MNRGLIIKKEWLDKIFDEGKIWEMRSSKTSIRGRIALIESGSGLIMGEVDLVDCSDKPIARYQSQFKFHKVEDTDLLKKWKYAWILHSPKRYAEPIPYTHPKGAVIWVKL